MCDNAELMHHIPGRMRIRIPAAKGDPGRAALIQNSLRGLSGVQSVEVNARLGTVLIHYDPASFKGFLTRLAGYATEQNLFVIGDEGVTACVSDANRSFNQFLGTLNRAVQGAMGGAINLKELIPVAVAVYGLLFVDKAVAAAQWLNWIQFAIDTYMDLHEQEPLADVAQNMEAMFADLAAQQAQSAEALRSELVALRSEIREAFGNSRPQ